MYSAKFHIEGNAMRVYLGLRSYYLGSVEDLQKIEISGPEITIKDDKMLSQLERIALGTGAKYNLEKKVK